ncbi:hypothetical protein RHMOL_Rhmol02G0263900 [Rhododendron molle]|uniref:Uncharacterized protein n=1 Tax=Rhododendron molle TaxID=49168 RepID=A0ACC0PUU7_RHOML|nr:hypothetical protein RHMOL_Rhmol02G0263900 [Rhododendron molle]
MEESMPLLSSHNCFSNSPFLFPSPSKAHHSNSSALRTTPILSFLTSFNLCNFQHHETQFALSFSLEISHGTPSIPLFNLSFFLFMLDTEYNIMPQVICLDKKRKKLSDARFRSHWRCGSDDVIGKKWLAIIWSCAHGGLERNF